MKTCKKLFTLALALILLMSVLVLPAMDGRTTIRYWPMQLLWWTDGFSRDD